MFDLEDQFCFKCNRKIIGLGDDYYCPECNQLFCFDCFGKHGCNYHLEFQYGAKWKIVKGKEDKK